MTDVVNSQKVSFLAIDVAPPTPAASPAAHARQKRRAQGPRDGSDGRASGGGAMQGAPVVLLRLGRLWLDTTHSLALSAREEEAMWSTIPTITFESIDARSRWWDGGVGEDGEGGRWGCVDGVVLVGWQRLVGLVGLVVLVDSCWWSWWSWWSWWGTSLFARRRARVTFEDAPKVGARYSSRTPRGRMV